MYKTYIRENITLVSVILFVIIFGTIQMMKPACFYNRDGSIREFGVGYRNKTILPIWLLSLLLGILCYLAVLYYISAPKIF
jgi:fumarate reductase subunit C